MPETAEKLNTSARDKRLSTESQSYSEVLSAAAFCFKENGFSATSIDDVARHLGATKGMIYHHFRSKVDLFFAVYRRGMEINVDAVTPHSKRNASALERLTFMALAHALTLMEHQAFQRVLSQGVALHLSGSTTAAQRETLVELIDDRHDYEMLFRRAIVNMAKEQSIKGLDYSVASKSFLSALNGNVFWYTPRAREPRKEQIRLAREMVAYALRGLGTDLSPETMAQWEETL